MADQPSPLEEFTTLHISIPSLPSFPISTTHHVYLRRNAKVLTKDDTRSLFLVNVPVDSTEAHWRGLFASLVGAGKFEAIVFERDTKVSPPAIEPAQAARLASHHKKRKREDEEAQTQKEEAIARLPPVWTRPLHRSGGSAVVLLADDRSVDTVLKAVKKLQKTKKFPVWGEGVGDKALPLGSTWLKAHNKLSYPGQAAMQAMVDAYFTVYNRKEAEAEQLARDLRNEPDADGFVTVTRGGRSAPARREEAEEAKRKMLERQQKRADAAPNFYRWQLREKKKAEQAAFLQQFEEDKSKVQAMREKRCKVQPNP